MTSRELQNRKIIEDLQQKKQLLLKQGVAASLCDTSTSLYTKSIVRMPVPTTPVESSQLLRSQGNQANASGYYIKQENNSYGNTFVPVIPRFYKEEIKTETADVKPIKLQLIPPVTVKVEPKPVVKASLTK